MPNCGGCAALKNKQDKQDKQDLQDLRIKPSLMQVRKPVREPVRQLVRRPAMKRHSLGPYNIPSAVVGRTFKRMF